jgi:DNA-binding transcriptional LysR family regulator
MDLIEALQAFRMVAEESSFTRGADRCGVPQPVVSRRVAALERRLGGALLERSTRSVTLTELGQRVLPHAEELLARWDLLEEATRETEPELVMAVPRHLDPRVLAGIRRGLAPARIRLWEEDPEERSQLWLSGRAAIAVLVAPQGSGAVASALGLGVAEVTADDRSLCLSQLRRLVRDRGERPRRIHLQPEDDVPAVRDPLARLARGHGLGAAQVHSATDQTEALTQLHEYDDVLVCTANEATSFGLGWRGIRGLALVRRQDVVARPGVLTGEQLARIAGRLGPGGGRR